MKLRQNWPPRITDAILHQLTSFSRNTRYFQSDLALLCTRTSTGTNMFFFVNLYYNKHILQCSQICNSFVQCILLLHTCCRLWLIHNLFKICGQLSIFDSIIITVFITAKYNKNTHCERCLTVGSLVYSDTSYTIFFFFSPQVLEQDIATHNEKVQELSEAASQMKASNHFMTKEVTNRARHVKER